MKVVVWRVGGEIGRGEDVVGDRGCGVSGDGIICIIRVSF